MPLIREDQSKGYLDLDNLSYKEEVESIAFLQEIKPDYTRNESKGFLRLYLREAGGNLVRGFKFDVEDFETQGNTLAGLRRRPVKIRYRVQVKNNFLSLLVYDIAVYTGEFDTARFMGGIETAKSDLEKSNQALLPYFGKEVFPHEYATESFLEVCEGRAGGFAQLVWAVLRNISFYFRTPAVDKERMYAVAYKSLNFYAQYLRTLNKADITLKHEIINMTYEASRVEDETLRNIIQDTCSALVGLGKPEHLYAHIICDSIKEITQKFSYSYQYPLIMKASSKKVGDDLYLARY